VAQRGGEAREVADGLGEGDGERGLVGVAGEQRVDEGGEGGVPRVGAREVGGAAQAFAVRQRVELREQVGVAGDGHGGEDSAARSAPQRAAGARARGGARKRVRGRVPRVR
jgi:hypothetical protein